MAEISEGWQTNWKPVLARQLVRFTLSEPQELLAIWPGCSEVGNPGLGQIELKFCHLRIRSPFIIYDC